MDAILNFSSTKSHGTKFDSIIAFYSLKNMDADTKTMALQCIIREICLHFGNASRHRLHLGKETYFEGGSDCRRL